MSENFSGWESVTLALSDAVSKANEFLSLLVGKRYLSSISCFLLENGLFSKIPSIYSFNGHRSRPIKAHHVVDRV